MKRLSRTAWDTFYGYTRLFKKPKLHSSLERGFYSAVITQAIINKIISLNLLLKTPTPSHVYSKHGRTCSEGPVVRICWWFCRISISRCASLVKWWINQLPVAESLHRLVQVVGLWALVSRVVPPPRIGLHCSSETHSVHTVILRADFDPQF